MGSKGAGVAYLSVLPSLLQQLVQLLLAPIKGLAEPLLLQAQLLHSGGRTQRGGGGGGEKGDSLGLKGAQRFTGWIDSQQRPRRDRGHGERVGAVPDKCAPRSSRRKGRMPG